MDTTTNTVSKMYESIGKTGIILLGGLQINVEILDVKSSYGKTRYQVKPVSGSGNVWVERVDFQY